MDDITARQAAEAAYFGALDDGASYDEACARSIDAGESTQTESSS